MPPRRARPRLPSLAADRVSLARLTVELGQDCGLLISGSGFESLAAHRAVPELQPNGLGRGNRLDDAAELDLKHDLALPADRIRCSCV